MAEPTKRANQLRNWAEEMKRSPEAWADANDAARAVRLAVDRLIDTVGGAVAADYLAMVMNSIRRTARSAERRRPYRMPSVTGRRSRNVADDEKLKAVLRGIENDITLRRTSLPKVARFLCEVNPRFRWTTPTSVEKHLKRLRKEIRLEDDAFWKILAGDCAPGEQNRLLIMARALAASAGTNGEHES